MSRQSWTTEVISSTKAVCGFLTVCLLLAGCTATELETSSVSSAPASSAIAVQSSSEAVSSIAVSSYSSSSVPEPISSVAVSSESSSSTVAAQSSSQANIAYKDGDHILGMDISYWSEQLDRGATYVDADGQTKDMLQLLKNHGVNFIRLRTFVNPWAQYGYASNSQCEGKLMPYNDKNDVIAMAKKVKAAGMGLLLDFHYSDTWADPSKQLIPEAWRSAQNIDQLANEVSQYTQNVLNALKAENALPNMVQVGNEITAGMMVHVPTDQTDCWGNNSVVSSRPNGVATNENWPNLSKLLKAGLAAVKTVDPKIKTVLHIENTGSVEGVEWWLNGVLSQGTQFDILGLSAYEQFQGPSSAWRSTLTRLANNYPALSFVIAEYNQEARLLNDIMRELPNKRGKGTFFWEPTAGGFWGEPLFTQEGEVFRVKPSDFSIFDQIKNDYGLGQ